MQLVALLDRFGDGPDETENDQIPCRVNEAEIWFAETPADVELAKAMCGTCPVRLECLAGAVQRAEPWGVWGGELFISGVVVARKRPRGRPRKDAGTVSEVSPVNHVNVASIGAVPRRRQEQP